MTHTGLLVLAIGLANPAGCAAAEKVDTHPDLVYAEVDGQKLQLDLFMPADVKKPPLIVYIHGGSWMRGSRKQPPVQWLTEEGFALASISYRFSDRAIFPAQIHDVKAAIRWLRTHQDKYGYDASRVGACGTSAGGHLAVLLGTSGGVKELEGTVGGNVQQSSRVRAVVDWYGPADFLLRSRTQPKCNQPGSSSYQLLGGPPMEKTELARLASGVMHVTPDDPPLLIFHGNKDTTVLPDQSERLRDVYIKARVEVTLQVIPNGRHDGAAEYFTGDSRRQVVGFFRKHLSPTGAQRRSARLLRSPESVVALQRLPLHRGSRITRLRALQNTCTCRSTIRSKYPETVRGARANVSFPESGSQSFSWRGPRGNRWHSGSGAFPVVQQEA